MVIRICYFDIVCDLSIVICDFSAVYRKENRFHLNQACRLKSRLKKTPKERARFRHQEGFVFSARHQARKARATVSERSIGRTNALFLDFPSILRLSANRRIASSREFRCESHRRVGMNRHLSTNFTLLYGDRTNATRPRQLMTPPSGKRLVL